MNTLLSLTENLQSFWTNTGFANAEIGHIVMIFFAYIVFFKSYCDTMSTYRLYILIILMSN